jgi:pimeloyl-ACP methyl ester carboxylesterase
MRDLLSVLDIERATVVGHSLGGGVAMQFAYQYPERCERLVLVSTGGVCPEVHPLLRFIAAPNADLLLPIVGAPGARGVGHTLFKLQALLGTDLGRDAEHLLRIFDALPDVSARRAFVRTLRSVVDWRGQAITMLDRCYLTRGMPTLLVWGERDPIIPVRHGQIAHEAMPGSRLEVFRESGHFPHLTQPQLFLEVLESFLASTEASYHSASAWREALRRGRMDTRTLASVDGESGRLLPALG